MEIACEEQSVFLIRICFSSYAFSPRKGRMLRKSTPSSQLLATWQGGHHWNVGIAVVAVRRHAWFHSSIVRSFLCLLCLVWHVPPFSKQCQCCLFLSYLEYFASTQHANFPRSVTPCLSLLLCGPSHKGIHIQNEYLLLSRIAINGSFGLARIS